MNFRYAWTIFIDGIIVSDVACYIYENVVECVCNLRFIVYNIFIFIEGHKKIHTPRLLVGSGLIISFLLYVRVILHGYFMLCFTDVQPSCIYTGHHTAAARSILTKMNSKGFEAETSCNYIKTQMESSLLWLLQRTILSFRRAGFVMKT